jgi:DNA-binding response OmpR family regulator
MSVFNMRSAIEKDVSGLTEPPQTPRILLVEDDHTLASLEADILTTHGFTVVAVESGEQAIALLHSSIPDLVVLDLDLTGHVQGWEVLEALRTTASIPVLLTTSSATAVRHYIRSRGETKSTLDHLPKPYPMHLLLKRIKRLLSTAPH